MTSIRPLDPAWRDPSTSPADDFYRYANGGWLAANPVPPEYGSWGAFHEVHVRNEELLRELLEEVAATPSAAGKPERMVGDFYASGMDVDQIERVDVEPLRPWLDGIVAIGDTSGLRAYAARARLHGIPHLFGTHVSPDFEDASRYLLYFTQGGLGLPERDYYFREDERSVGLRREYEGHVTKMLEMLGEDPDPVAAAQDIMALETELAAASLTPAERRDVDRTTNKRSIAELEELAPNFGLPGFLAGLGVGVDSVNLEHPDFFATVDRLVAELPVATWHSYLRWNLIRATAPSLPARFDEEHFRFYGKTLGGQQQQKERWKRVLAAATADIGQQVSRLFVARAFPPEAKARCEQMVARLREAMAESIRTRPWMTEATKRQALDKLSAFGLKIGYPDEWRDYTGLEIDRGPYVGNRLRAAAFETRRKLDKLGEVVESEWEMPPHVVNAYYHPTHNEIVFPAGILQPPFFDAGADDAVNFGGIGAVIGHEVTHGFDDQGSKFDAAGNLRNWWTDDDRAEFEARARGLVDQYSAYEVAPDVQVNGELTLGENIADLGGLAVAFRAFVGSDGDGGTIDGLTSRQRFFLSYATVWRANYTDEYLRLLVTTDPHAPHDVRCNGPLSNFPPFWEAFDIPQGAAMRRGEVVEIW